MRSSAMACALWLSVCMHGVQASEPVYSLHIPAGSADESLRTLARLTGHALLYRSAEVRTIRTGDLSGNFTLQQALAGLLQGTNLSGGLTEGGVIAVARSSSHTTSDREAVVTKGEKQSVIASISAFAMSLFGAQSSAQDTTSTGGGVLDEVIVTAQKRAESVLDVPISITALSAKDLEAVRAMRLDSYVFNIPNATFTMTGTSSPRVVMRGVNNGGGQYSPIAITIDDSSYGAVDMRPILTSQAFDVERIEVLRGPQGTLTGSSSLGGTLNIVTVRPNTEALELKATLDYGRFNTRLHKGVVNVPISDDFAVRAVAYTQTSDGAVKNIGPGGGSSSKDHYGTRVAALWNATDALTINASISYEQLRYGLDDNLYLNRHSGGPSVTAARQAQLAALGGVYFDPAVDFIEQAGTNGGSYKIDDPDHHDIENLMASFRATYDFGPAALDVIYGHLQSSLDGSQDLDRSEYAVQRNHYYWDNKANTVELRLTSDSSGPFNWVIGATYVKDELPQGGRLGGSPTGAYAGRYPLTQEFRTWRGIETQAAFANVFWDILPRLHLSAGVRFTQVENSFGNAAVFAEGVPLPTMVRIKGKTDEVDPRLALSFDVTDTSMLYVQSSTGFRPGYGNNPLVVGTHNTAGGVIDVPEVVDNEYLRNYEVGYKGTLFDQRVSYALAAFYMDYQDLQIRGPAILDPGFESFTYDRNFGAGSAKGMELELNALLTDAWSVQLSTGYVDTELKRPGTARSQITGIRPWTANFSNVFEKPITADYNGTFRLDYKWQARTFDTVARTPESELPKFGILNLTTGVSTDRWSLMAYMDNITDEIYWVGTAGGTSLRGTRAIFIPRTFGLRFNFNLRSER